MPTQRSDVGGSARTNWWQPLRCRSGDGSLHQFDDPLVLLLLVAIVISLGAWFSDGADEVPLEAVVIAAIVLLNAIIGFWQEARAIEAVEGARRHSPART